MTQHTHTGHDIALEQEFEWVNAWATSSRAGAQVPAAEAPAAMTRPAAAGKAMRPDARPSSEPALAHAATNGFNGAKAPVSEIDLTRVEFIPALDPDGARCADATPSVPETRDASPDQDGANGGLTDGIEIADNTARRRAGRWTSLFRLATRVREAARAEPDPAEELFVQAPARADEPRAAAAEKTIIPDQLARDIAEIVMVRDRLMAMPLARESSVRSFIGVRTSDAVPILVGVVLAFTSMIVFAVAASFVSLR